MVALQEKSGVHQMSQQQRIKDLRTKCQQKKKKKRKSSIRFRGRHQDSSFVYDKCHVQSVQNLSLKNIPRNMNIRTAFL